MKKYLDIRGLTHYTEKVKETVNNAAETLDTKINNTKDELNNTIDILDTKVDTEVTRLDTKIDNTATTLDTKIDTEVTTLNTKVDNEVTTLNTKIDANKSETDEDISTLNTKVDTEVTRLDTKIDNSKSEIDGELETLDNKITTLDTKVDTTATTLDTKIDTTKDELNSNIDNVSTTLDTKIDSTKQELDGEIETLDTKVDTEATRLNNKIDTTATTLDTKINSTKQELDENISDLQDEDTKLEGDISNLKTKDSELESSITNLSNTKADKTEIPTVVSELDNDMNYIDNTVDDLVNYYDKSTVDSKIFSVYKYKGTVHSYNDLPRSELTVGDVYNIETADDTHNIKAGDNVAWSGEDWDVLAGTVDLSGYQTKIDSSHKLSSDLVDDTNNTNKFVSSTDKTNWNAKYDKPSTGIPKTDLEQNVQDSLDLADSAIQSTDYASTNTGGVIKSADSYGTQVNANGQLFCKELSYENYVASNTNKFISKGTLENVIKGKELENQTVFTVPSPLDSADAVESQNALDLVNLKKGIYFNNSPNIGTQYIYFKLPSGRIERLQTQFTPHIILIVKEASEWTDSSSNGIFCYFIGVDRTSGNAQYYRKIIGISYENQSLSITYSKTYDEIALNSQSQNIRGVKTFNSIPKQSDTTAPTNDAEFTNKKYVDDKDALKEDIANKVTSLSALSTDDEYPSAKAVFDLPYDNVYMFDNNTVINLFTAPRGVYIPNGKNRTFKYISKKSTGATSTTSEYILYLAITKTYDEIIAEGSGTMGWGLGYRIQATSGSVDTGDRFLFTRISKKPDVDELIVGVAEHADFRYLTSVQQYIGGKKLFGVIPELHTYAAPTQDVQLTPKKYVDDQDALKEDIANKVTSLDDQSTDDQYPSAKAVFDLIKTKGKNIQTFTNDNKNPFIFDGKLPGIYVNLSFENSYSSRTGDFYYKKSESSSVQSLWGLDCLFIIIEKDINDAQVGDTIGVVYAVLGYDPGATAFGGIDYRLILKDSDGFIKLDNYGRYQSIGISFVTRDRQNFTGVKTFSSIPQVSSYTAPTNNMQLTAKKYVDDRDTLKEDVANKVTTIDSTSTDTQYASAKAVWDLVNQNNFSIGYELTEYSSTSPFNAFTKEPGIYIPKYEYYNINYFYYYDNKESLTNPRNLGLHILFLVIYKNFDDAEVNEVFGKGYAINNSNGGITYIDVRKSTSTVLTIGAPAGLQGGLITYNNQEITGVKTFSSIPQVSSYTAPTQDTQLTAKKYVDDLVASMSGDCATETCVVSQSEPFVFEGKKKGIYHIIYNNVTSFYFKGYEAETVKNIEFETAYMFYIILKDDFENINENEVLGYTFSIQSSTGVIYRGACVKTSSTVNIQPRETTLFTAISNGNQEYLGVKTFYSIPKLSSYTAPTQDTQLAAKKYVDDSISAIPSGASVNYFDARQEFLFEGKDVGVYYPTNTNRINFMYKFLSDDTGGGSNGTVVSFIINNKVTAENPDTSKVYAVGTFLDGAGSLKQFVVTYNGTKYVMNYYDNYYAASMLTVYSQTFRGEKIFVDIPKVSSYTAPTNNTQLTAKKYVDDSISAAIGDIGTVLDAINGESI